MAKVHTLSLDARVDVYRSSGIGPGQLCRDPKINGFASRATIQIAEPVQRWLGEEKTIAVPLILARGRGEETYILFHDLSVKNQAQVRQLFPKVAIPETVH